MENKDKYLEKVRKALALAGNNPSIEEAQTAMLHAQRLMAKYNISMADAAPVSVAVKRDVVRKHTPIKEILWWKKDLASAIAQNFRCRTTTSAGRGINFYGFEEDADIAQMVYSFAEITIIYLSKKFVKDNVEKGARARAVPLKNSYITGFLQGLTWALYQQMQEESMALVLVRDPAVDEHLSMVVKPKAARDSNRVLDGDQFAVAEGYKDGKNFDHTKKQLTADRDAEIDRMVGDIRSATGDELPDLILSTENATAYYFRDGDSRFKIEKDDGSIWQANGKAWDMLG